MPILESIVGSKIYGFGSFISRESFDSIASTTSTGSSITFNSIPSNYYALQIRAFMPHSETSQSSIKIEFNGDTGANYAYHYGYSWSTSSVNSAGTTAANNMNVLTTIGGTSIGGAAIIDIHNYANTSQYKVVKTFSGADANNASAGGVRLASGLWLSTAAINSITIGTYGGTFVSGSSFALYGIKGA